MLQATGQMIGFKSSVTVSHASLLASSEHFLAVLTVAFAYRLSGFLCEGVLNCLMLTSKDWVVSRS